MKGLHMLAFILLVVGGLNWGLVGLGWWMGGANWNLVEMIFGAWPMLVGLVYVLVGLSAVYLLFTHPKDCMVCASKK